MHLLQCCNVGDICGGTAACAWSLARALPSCRHTVVFFGTVTGATRKAFAGCEVVPLGRLEPSHVRRFGSDAVILHNTPARRVMGPLPAVTLMYHHSHFKHPARADAAIYCSRWLAEQYRADPRLVCYQGVPVAPKRRAGESASEPVSNPTVIPTRPLAHSPTRQRALVVGRLCSSQVRKWPEEVVDFYRELSRRLPRLRWEFVGCPAELQPRLKEACEGRARFLPVGWNARQRLWHWDVLCYSNPVLPESFGRVCAEAMRTGCVPVVDRQGGFCEQVEDGVSGFLCDGVDQFADALARLEERAVWAQFSRAAQERANRLFSLRAFAQRILTWLEAAARAAA